MRTPESLQKGAERLHAARPQATIILFGSQARGDARRFRAAAAVPGTLYHTVAREGKVVYGGV